MAPSKVFLYEHPINFVSIFTVYRSEMGILFKNFEYFLFQEF